MGLVDYGGFFVYLKFKFRGNYCILLGWTAWSIVGVGGVCFLRVPGGCVLWDRFLWPILNVEVDLGVRLSVPDRCWRQ